MAATEIIDAVHASMKEIDYTPHFQVGHPSSFELARKVAKITPGDLDYVFFCNSGSEAGRNRDQDRARLSRGQRRRPAHPLCQPRARLSWRQYRRRLARAAWSATARPSARVMPGVAHLRHTWQPEARFTRGQPEQGRRSRQRSAALRRPLWSRNPSPPVSSSRSPGRPAFSFRPRAISNACARSATRTASCWCSTK